MKNCKVAGKKIFEATATGTVTAGTPLLYQNTLFVPIVSGSSGDKITGYEDGEFDLPKVAGQAWTEGQALFWVVATSNFSTTAGANSAAVGTVGPGGALSAATTGPVKLTGVPRALPGT